MFSGFTFHDRRSDAARPTPLEFYHKIRSRLDELSLPWEDDKLYPYVYNPERENVATFMGKPLRTPEYFVTEHTGREIRERAIAEMKNQVYQADCREGLAYLPDESIDCCITSPPYFGLRDYGHPNQVGQEESVAAYIDTMVQLFAQVHRVLKPEGTLWLNLGDTFANDGKWGGSTGGKHASGVHGTDVGRKRQVTGLKPKDLIGIPWRVALALQEWGWYLRQDIIWAKPNPMPESVKDRCTRSHEYIFMLTKQPRYYYNAEAIKTPAKDPADDLRRVTKANARVTDSISGIRKKAVRTDKQRGHSRRHEGFNDRWDGMSKAEQQAAGANKRSVWTVGTRPFPEAHFATFPQDLIVDCIRAGCPEGGLILDPFFGAGTTGLVARKQGRNYVGIEVNPEYVSMARQRIAAELGGLFE